MHSLKISLAFSVDNNFPKQAPIVPPDPNDALAVMMMKEHRNREIYSYDKDFDGLEEVVRLLLNILKSVHNAA